MGLSVEIMWHFMGIMLVGAIVGTIILVIINKLFMYHGPEDEEVWSENDNHFVITEWMEKDTSEFAVK